MSNSLQNYKEFFEYARKSEILWIEYGFSRLFGLLRRRDCRFVKIDCRRLNQWTT